MIAIVKGAHSFFEESHAQTEKNLQDHILDLYGLTLPDFRATFTPDPDTLPARSEPLLEEIMAIPSYDWQALNRRLASIVQSTLEEKEITTAELAKKINLEEEALLAYLDPETPDAIGIYFLACADELDLKKNIRKIFPFGDKETDKKCWEMLDYTLRSIEPPSIIHLLHEELHENFQAHFAHLLYRGLVDRYQSETSGWTKQRPSEEEFFDPMLSQLAQSLSYKELEFAAYNRDFRRIIQSKNKPSAEDWQEVAECLSINPEDIFVLRPISGYEVQELLVRQTGDWKSEPEEEALLGAEEAIPACLFSYIDILIEGAPFVRAS